MQFTLGSTSYCDTATGHGCHLGVLYLKLCAQQAGNKNQDVGFWIYRIVFAALMTCTSNFGV